MKSKTSCFSKTIFFKNVTRFWPIWTLYLVYLLGYLPARLYRNFGYTAKNSGYTAEEAVRAKELYLSYAVYQGSRPYILFGVCLVAAMAVFSYLYFSRSANMLHALPVTRKQLYFTNYISGLAFLILPQIIAFLTSVLVCTVFQVTSLEFVLLWLLYSMGMTVLFYSMTILMGMITGNILAVPVFALIFNFLFAGAKLLFSGLEYNLSYGITGNFTESRADMLSPLVYLMDHVKLTYAYSAGAREKCTGFLGGSAIVVYAVVGIVFAFASYYLYKHRQLEKTGDLLTVGCMIPVFRWGSALAAAGVGSVVGADILNVDGSMKQIHPGLLAVCMLIFSVAAFFAAQMLIEKNFRVFKKVRIGEWCVIAGIVLVFVASVEFDVLGLEKKIPKEDTIASVRLGMNQQYGGDDAASIEAVMKVHQEIIDSKEEYEAFMNEDTKEEDRGYVYITYNLKNGTVLERYYTIPKSEAYREDNTSVYSMVGSLLNTEEAYLRSAIGVNYKDAVLRGGSIDLYGEDDSYRSLSIDTDDAETIYQAFLEDIRDGSLYNLNEKSGEEYNNDVYYNSVQFDYYVNGGKGLQSIYNAYSIDEPDDEMYAFYAGKSSYESVTIQFDSNCTHIVQALIDTGVIQDAGELITIADKMQLDEAQQ